MILKLAHNRKTLGERAFFCLGLGTELAQCPKGRETASTEI